MEKQQPGMACGGDAGGDLRASGAGMTRAPLATAIARVESVLPQSATTISATGPNAAIAATSVRSAFRVGMMTERQIICVMFPLCS